MLALAAGLVLAVALVDWNQARGPISRFASARLGRPVVIQGDLEVHPFSWRPSATVNDLKIGNPAWAGDGELAEIGRLHLQVKLLPLLAGRIAPIRIEADRPVISLVRDAQGRANWDFSNGRKSRPLELPALRMFVIRDGRLRVDDAQRKLKLEARLSADERGGEARAGFQMRGDGQINAEPFALVMRGGPLLNNRADRPYPFTADIQAGATRLQARGVVPKPFKLGRLSADLVAKGPDLADLFPLTGVSLPNTPPYDLKGGLARNGEVWTMTGLGGRVGDSDLTGELSVDAGRERPFLRADLKSKRLDFDDLATVFGGAPSRVQGEAVSARQDAIGRQMAAQRRLFPDAQLNVTRLRAMDADVKYAAASIDAPWLPLRAASLRVKLDDGLLVADPMKLDLPQGSVNGRATLDARPSTPVSTVDVRLSDARLEQLIPGRNGGPAPLYGSVVGRVKLQGAGASVHEAVSHADGEVLAVVPGGEIRRAFAELLGVNVTKGLGLLLSDDQSKTDVRCALAHFQAKDGVLRADHIVFDTGPVLGEGSGSVNLGAETVDLKISGEPKEPRLVRLMAPVTLKGPLAGPKLGVDAAGALGQGGIAAALGAVAPLAAILPFVDLGLAEDTACGALIAEGARQGAPVKSARP